MMRYLRLFLLIFLLGVVISCHVYGDDSESGVEQGVWELTDVIIDKNSDTNCKTQCIGESVTCYDCTNDLTETSYSYKEDHKECWGSNDLADWGATASWEKPPDTLIPGEALRVKGQIEFSTETPNWGRDSLTIQFNGAGCPHKSWCEPYYPGSLVAAVDSASPTKSIDDTIEIPLPTKDGEEIRLQYALWGGTVHYVYTYHKKGDTTVTPCDRLKVDIEEIDNTCISFTVQMSVIDICTYQPIPDIYLDIRVFYLYKASSDTWMNGNYKDYEDQYYTDSSGTCTFNLTGLSPGDMYRVDVYASKDGWDTDDTSLAVTVGEGLDCPDTLPVTPLLLIPGSVWTVQEYGPMGDFDGVWTVGEDGMTIEAGWGNIRDVIDVVSVVGDQITLHRRGNDGFYTGTIATDGRGISGTGSWYSPGQTWEVTLQ